MIPDVRDPGVEQCYVNATKTRLSCVQPPLVASTAIEQHFPLIEFKNPEAKA